MPLSHESGPAANDLAAALSPRCGARLRPRLFEALLATVGAGCGLLLAWHYPLSGLAASMVWVLVAWATFRWPRAWLIGLPAVLPAIGGMPWTGWLSFEEWDLAVLAIGAGGYARLAVAMPVQRHRPAAQGRTALKVLLLLLWLVSVGISLTRGFADAGGFQWGWWQGYHEPMNSWRLAKSAFLSVWLLPLWRALQRESPAASARGLGLGMAAGLGVVSLLVVWERLAFTDLLNFSSDYRVTALFWEMHVGGAALDGFLALTMPFAVRELMRPVGAWRGALSVAVVVLGSYSSLVTFSRGVYLALPLGLVAMALLHALQAWRLTRGVAAPDPIGRRWLPALALAGGFSAAALLMFPSSGYRGVLAALGAFALLLPLAGAARRLPPRLRAAGVILGAVTAVMLGMLAYLLPRGPYLAYAAAWAAGAGALVMGGRATTPAMAETARVAALAAFVAVLPMVPIVALHWGEDRALAPAAAVSMGLALAAALGAGGAAPRWPESLRWQAALFGGMSSCALVVGVLLGGAYMGTRFSTGEHDLQGRMQHWSRGLALLTTPSDWVFGKGLGRVPANFLLFGMLQDHVGDYNWRPDTGRLLLSAGKHDQDWGSMFRVSQRIGPVRRPVAVELKLRAEQDAGIHVEICRKHLLYDGGGCLLKSVQVKAKGGAWQIVRLELQGRDFDRGDWYAPGLIAFSMAVNVSGRAIEIEEVRATAADGRAVLRNGDFAEGMSHWFFSSDRHHMPWHMKSMPLHLLFEQGWVGLALFAVLWLGAMWRVSAGAARDHELAPACAAALLGFAVVGLFDSLLDAPRVAFVYWLLLWVALSLPRRVPGRPSGEAGG